MQISELRGRCAIKGPSRRLRHDVRRVWQCPACGRRERTGGDVVQRDCRCRAGEDPPQTTAMRLLEGKEAAGEAVAPPDARRSGTGGRSPL